MIGALVVSFDGRRIDVFACIESMARNRQVHPVYVIQAILSVLWAALAVPGVAADWADTRQVGRITVASEVRLERFVGILTNIQQQQADVLATLDLQGNQTPIEIYIFSSRKSYAEFVARQAPEAINRRASFAKNEDGIGRVFIYVQDEFDTDLRHELTHAVLHASLPFVPLWLDEGLAEYFEANAEDRASRNPHQARLKWSMRLFWKPNLDRLERKDSLIEMTNEDYRESWAWVHFLLHGPSDVRHVLPEYLQAIHAGEPPGPLSKVLIARDPNAGRRLLTHFKSWK